MITPNGHSARFLVLFRLVHRGLGVGFVPVMPEMMVSVIRVFGK